MFFVNSRRLKKSVQMAKRPANGKGLARIRLLRGPKKNAHDPNFKG